MNNMSLNTLENLTTQLRSKLDEEKQQNSTMRTELEQINERFEQKEIEYAELETKLLTQKQQADEKETKLKSELDSVRKEKHHTFNKLQKTRNLLDSEKHKATLLKTRAKTSAATFCAEISKTASLSIPVIAQNQLFSDPESKTCSKGIGSGTFGDCFLRNYRNFLSILFGISHKKEAVPYIVTKFHGSQRSTKNTLYSLLSQTPSPYSTNDFIQLALECAKGLMHMHNNNILHNDLKTNNVVVEIVNDQPCAVIIDFGKSCYVGNARVKRIPIQERDDYRKRHPHIAPEIVNMTRSQSLASDVYSYGVLLQNMNYLCDKKLEHALRVAREERLEKRASLDTLTRLIQTALVKS